jgi:hypothetical protein
MRKQPIMSPGILQICTLIVELRSIRLVEDVLVSVRRVISAMTARYNEARINISAPTSDGKLSVTGMIMFKLYCRVRDKFFAFNADGYKMNHTV